MGLNNKLLNLCQYSSKWVNKISCSTIGLGSNKFDLTITPSYNNCSVIRSYLIIGNLCSTGKGWA